MTYKEAREYIDQSNQYGNELSLEAIKELLRRLGNPQDRIKVIHVAGTNGKGSTTAFIASILAMQGYKVGRYISPAVFSYQERIQITERAKAKLKVVSEVETEDHIESSMEASLYTDYITEKGICESVDVIKKTCEEMVKDGCKHPTCFEVETVMAMLYFVSEQVDFAVIEVGLGGRLDATNVMKQPVCCVITSISMDHMQYLGDTIEQIAGEKAGIIKEGVPVVTSNSHPGVLRVLGQTCEDLKTELVIADYETASGIEFSPEGTTFHYGNHIYTIQLLGEHQINNAVLALKTAEVLRKQGYQISDNALKNGLLQTKWRGRFEILARNPYLIIDGAHNEDAALQLRKTLLTYFPERRLVFIMGVLADKDYRSVLNITAPLASVIITITPDNSRALASMQLAIEAKKYCSGFVIDAGNVKRALDYAYEEVGREDVIIAFGSLSFLGELSETVTHYLPSSDQRY